MSPTEIADALEAIARQAFDPEEFPFAFAAATGNAPATVSKLRPGQRSLNRSKLRGGVLVNKKFHFLPAVSGEVDAAIELLRTDKKTDQHKPAILIASDGDIVVAENPATRETLRCAFNELHRHFGFFLPAAGMTRFKAADENEVDVRATGKLARLYDALLKLNPDWGTPERRHELNQFMTRLIFCLFAEDVGIFPKDQFSRLTVNHAGHKGAEAHIAITHAFQAMNRPASEREDLPGWTHEFEYVNGGLFAGPIDCPVFDAIAWGYFRDSAELDWRDINPDIFGSMIQTIAEADKRGELGMHYTSVPNILKVIGPLFLDDLDSDIDKAWDKPAALERVLRRLSRIRVFDPACGSGNFLVIAYRELRVREMKILDRLKALKGETQGQMWSSISLASFHGIEITDFAAETAKLALFIAEYQANSVMEKMFGAAASPLPLRDGGHIVCDNALRIDWEDVCPPPREDEEVYIAGNPPFLGSTYQSKAQKTDLAFVFSGQVQSYAAFDFVAAWFFKASNYIRARPAKAALVATNSICQGYSVAALWPHVLGEDLEIGFAHKDFKWRNNAASNAAVVCSIIGVRNRSGAPKRLIVGGNDFAAPNINTYLSNGPDVVVAADRKSIFDLPFMDYGNKPADGGGLILSTEERDRIVSTHPEAAEFIFKYLGSKEVVRGEVRHCIWITDDNLERALKLSPIAERINEVRQFRLASPKEPTRRMAERPFEFDQIRIRPGKSSLFIPRHTSENRPFLPVDLVAPDTVSSDANMVLNGAPEWCLALIASRLHLVWIGTVCGRLESRFRYSNTLGWNTFPVPKFTEAQLKALNASARDILKTRYLHHPKTIADLYDPEKMPDDLREVHRRNDELLETMYIGRPFKTDTERLEKLFKLYAARVEKLKPNKTSKETA
ncbi:DNA methyltransferase [Maricaulis sp.]|uniref:class I SAM-dependent DNA methyltransferase n=1 Tax=Maricaulis sp. TaxID=1486257 RepID=UPI003456E900